MPRARASFDWAAWKRILVRTGRETLKDDAEGLAAQLSYYFFLSLFPLLLALVALASLFPLQNLTDDVARFLGPFAPAAAITLIRDQMLQIAQRDHTGLLSVGLVSAVWSSSAAMGAVVSAMNRAYGIEERRPWWRVRLIAIGLTLGLALFILVSLSLVLAGPQAADALAARLGLSAVLAWTWKIIQWPLVVALVVTAIGLIYRFAPDTERQREWLSAGALVATVLWLLASLVFRAYVVHFGNYEGTYGTIGGIIIVLLWFYVSGFAIVIGAELDSEIDRELVLRAQAQTSPVHAAHAASGHAASAAAGPVISEKARQQPQ